MILPSFFTSLASTDLFIFSANTSSENYFFSDLRVIFFSDLATNFVVGVKTIPSPWAGLHPDSRYNLVAMFLWEHYSRQCQERQQHALRSWGPLPRRKSDPWLLWLDSQRNVSLRMEISKVFNSLFIPRRSVCIPSVTVLPWTGRRESLEDTDLELRNTVGVFVLHLHVDSQFVKLLWLFCPGRREYLEASSSTLARMSLSLLWREGSA